MGRKSNSRRLAGIGLIMSLHLLASSWLLWWYERGYADILLLLAWAVPVAQVTLLAVWAALGRLWIGLRLPLALLLVTVAWYIESRLLAFEPDDPRTAAHAVMVFVQFTSIAGVVGLYRVVAWILQRPDESCASRPIQYGLVSVLVWMLGVGMVLGVWRLVLSYNGWSIEVVRSEFFLYGVAIGVCNAVLGLLIATAVLWGRNVWRILAQVTVALVLVGALLWVQQDVLEAIFAGVGNMSRVAWLTQGGCQTSIILVSLAPLRRIAYNN